MTQEALHLARAIVVVMSRSSIVCEFEAQPAPVRTPHPFVPGICMIFPSKTGLQACLSSGSPQNWAIVWKCDASVSAKPIDCNTLLSWLQVEETSLLYQDNVM